MCVIAKLPAHTNENANFSVGGRPVFRSGLFQLGAFSCSAHPTETLPLCPARTPMVLPPIFPAVPPTDPTLRALQGSPSTAFQFLLQSHFLTEAGLLFYQNQLLPQPPHLGPNPSAPQPIPRHVLSLCPAFRVFPVLITHELMLQRPVPCLLSACSKVLSVRPHIPSQSALSTQ